MATTTTNFGWDIPQSTDLVKDGATAIAALGQDIDTAFIDLKGGTTGQVLAKASGTDLDFSWVAQDDSNAIQNAIVDAKGDLISATAADTPARLAVGTNGQILTVDSAEATGLKWATPAAAASGLTFISRQTFSNVAAIDFTNVFTSTYEDYVIKIERVYAGTNNNDAIFQFLYNTNTVQSSGYYGACVYGIYSSTSVTGIGMANTSGIIMNDFIGGSADPSSHTINVSQVGNGTRQPMAYGHNVSSGNGSSANFGGYATTSRVYTGFRILSSSTNITGAITIYGLAKS